MIPPIKVSPAPTESLTCDNRGAGAWISSPLGCKQVAPSDPHVQYSAALFYNKVTTRIANFLC